MEFIFNIKKYDIQQYVKIEAFDFQWHSAHKLLTARVGFDGQRRLCTFARKEYPNESTPP
jgi:hypothetical protein